MPGPIVDRSLELQTFIDSLESPPQQATSILLVEDNSGQGKTRLLELYCEQCRKRQIPVAHVDLKSGSLSPIDILWSARQDLRLPFPRCDEALKRPHFTSPSFQIRDNRALGQTSYIMPVNVNIAGLSPDEQRQLWAVGAQAFLEDLIELSCSSQSRFVFLFDTFEKAKPETQTWIADHVLRMATPSRVACLVIVLAGKQVPDPTGEWAHCCQRLSLQSLQLKDWQEYARLIKSSLSADQIRQLYTKCAGRTLEMANIIDMFADRGSPNAR
jgi:hypothetical protein